MKAHQAEIEWLIRHKGVIARRDHPALVSALAWQVDQRRLVSVLPGIYLHPDDIDDPLMRIRAAAAWAPEAVLTGQAAAKVTFWTQLQVDGITLATRHGRPSRPGFTVAHRQIPPELIWESGGLRVTSAALTALDLVAETGRGEAIDEVLRTGSADMGSLQTALAAVPRRRGNRTRAALLLDSRDEPWSEAERMLHRILRAAGLTGWKTNVKVCPDGCRFYIDVSFKRQKLAIEVDGFEHHSKREVFETDRARQNVLVLDGWTVLRYTWRMITEEPERVLGEIRTALETNKSARR